MLLQDLQSLTDVLVHSQSDLRKHIDENLKVDHNLVHAVCAHVTILAACLLP